MKHKKGFTLIELLAVIAILAIILLIAVPLIMQTLKTSKEEAFKLNAKLLIHAMELKAAENDAFDPTTVNETNIKDILNLDDSNYESVTVTVDDNLIEVTIVGKNKWDGLTATGNTKGILVSSSSGGGELVISDYSQGFNFTVILDDKGDAYIDAVSKRYIPFPILNYSSDSLSDAVMISQMSDCYTKLHHLVEGEIDYSSYSNNSKIRDLNVTSYMAYTYPTNWKTQPGEVWDTAYNNFDNQTWVNNLETNTAYTTLRDEVLNKFEDWRTNNTHVYKKIPGVANVEKVFVHSQTVFFVMKDGTLKGLGDNLGLGNEVFSTNLITFTGLTNVNSVFSASNTDNIFITTDSGDVYGYGFNSKYVPSLGLTHNNAVFTPTLIPSLNSTKTIVSSKSGRSFAAVLANGTVKSWGFTDYGQVPITGQGTYLRTPTLIPSLTNVKTLSSGDDSYYAVRNDGTLAVWGKNDTGQLGIGTIVNVTSGFVNTALTNVKKVAASIDHSIALLNNGDIYLTGKNWDQVMGITQPENTPIRTYRKEFASVTGSDIESGPRGLIIINDSGDLYCSGDITPEAAANNNLLTKTPNVSNVTAVYFEDLGPRRRSRLNYITNNKTIASIGTSDLWSDD